MRTKIVFLATLLLMMTPVLAAQTRVTGNSNLVWTNYPNRPQQFDGTVTGDLIGPISLISNTDYDAANPTVGNTEAKITATLNSMTCGGVYAGSNVNAGWNKGTFFLKCDDKFIQGVMYGKNDAQGGINLKYDGFMDDHEKQITDLQQQIADLKTYIDNKILTVWNEFQTTFDWITKVENRVAKIEGCTELKECMKPDCPYQCCPLNSFKEKKCPIGQSCISNVCVTLTTTTTTIKPTTTTTIPITCAEQCKNAGYIRSLCFSNSDHCYYAYEPIGTCGTKSICCCRHF